IITVTQAGTPCTYAYFPDRTFIGAAGSPLSVGVRVLPTDCSWTLSSGSAWVTPSSVAGKGNANAGFTVAPNNTDSKRSCILQSSATTISIPQLHPPIIGVGSAVNAASLKRPGLAPGEL